MKSFVQCHTTGEWKSWNMNRPDSQVCAHDQPHPRPQLPGIGCSITLGRGKGSRTSKAGEEAKGTEGAASGGWRTGAACVRRGRWSSGPREERLSLVGGEERGSVADTGNGKRRRPGEDGAPRAHGAAAFGE